MTNEPSRYGTGPDDLSEAEPIAVTEEMLKAVENYVICCCNAMPKDLTEIYRAMATVAPSSDLADRHAQQKKTICELLDDRDAALARAEAMRDQLRDEIATLEQRLAALEPKPEPTPDPFREFPVDRRRIGG